MTLLRRSSSFEETSSSDSKRWLFRDVKYIRLYRDLHEYREIQKLANHLVWSSSFFKDHTSPNRIIPLFFALSLHTIRLLLIPVQPRRQKIPCALKQYPTSLPFTLFSISSLLRSPTYPLRNHRNHILSIPGLSQKSRSTAFRS